MSARCSEALEETRRLIFDVVRALPHANGAEPRLLDVGCWEGETTQGLAQTIGAKAYGIEIFPEQAARARARGIEVSIQDLETEPFPWPDQTMDMVIANQVLEHLKNVWLPMSEIFRVLRVGGHCVIGVPNLASLHNRVMLALGLQPSSIRTRGPHVRGFTAREARNFVALEGACEDVRVRGAGFYPFPARWAGPLAGLWAGGSHTVIVVGRKRATSGNPWREVMEREIETQQTHFGQERA